MSEETDFVEFPLRRTWCGDQHDCDDRAGEREQDQHGRQADGWCAGARGRRMPRSAQRLAPGAWEVRGEDGAGVTCGRGRRAQARAWGSISGLWSDTLVACVAGAARPRPVLGRERCRLRRRSGHAPFRGRSRSGHGDPAPAPIATASASSEPTAATSVSSIAGRLLLLLEEPAP